MSEPDKSFDAALRPDVGDDGRAAIGGVADRVQSAVSGVGRSTLRPGVARVDGLVQAAGRADKTSGALSGGGQRSPGAGSADGSTFRQAGGGEPHVGPLYNAEVPPGGYLWWYADGLSDCGRYGIAVIAFVGSVFSPYYAFSGRKDPGNHLCINVALYTPDHHFWAMTERGRKSSSRSAHHFEVGPSSLDWDGEELVIRFDEISVPKPPAQFLPKRIAGSVRFKPAAITGAVFDIDAAGKHRWWPMGPSGDIKVVMKDGTGPDWNGHGYMDCNWGTEPIEAGFTRWDWARGTTHDGGSVIIYDSERRDGTADVLALRIGPDGKISNIAKPDKTRMPRAFWGVARYGHHDKGTVPKLVKTLEDGPFYTRSVIDTVIDGEPVQLMHEGLSGTRFGNPIVKAMLAFRMPRRG
jgi:carotenoid 1,2-hydratase